MRVGIALGSNLGNRLARLRAAAAAIHAFAEPPVRASRVYETAPVDCPAGSPGFLNAALEIGFSGSPAELLARLKSIEHANERPADQGRNAPRTVDLDILYADEMVIESPELTIPHPRLMERLFVLYPLCDVAPDRCLPHFSESFLTRKRYLEETRHEIVLETDNVLL